MFCCGGKAVDDELETTFVGLTSRSKLVKDSGSNNKIEDVYSGVPVPSGKNGAYVGGKLLGSGGTAQVYEIKHKQTRTKYALKIIKLFRLEESKRAMLLQEIPMIKQLDHPRVVKVIEVFRRVNYMLIVMELLDGGDLFSRLLDEKINPSGRFEEGTTRNLTEQMLSALQLANDKKAKEGTKKLEQ